MNGKVASEHCTNSQHIPRLQAESTHLAAPNSKRTHTKAGLSRPYNGTVSGLRPTFVALQGSQEKQPTRGALKPSHNVLDRLGQNAKEDLLAHLDARRTSTSSKKNDVPAFSPVHDKINGLRKRLNKLTTKSSEATPSMTSLPFSLKI